MHRRSRLLPTLAALFCALALTAGGSRGFAQEPPPPPPDGGGPTPAMIERGLDRARRLVERRAWDEAEAIVRRIRDEGGAAAAPYEDQIQEIERQIRTGRSGLGDQFHGEVSVPEEGRIRLAYEFDTATEMQDFQGSAGRVEGGKLSARGTFWLRQTVSQPVRVEARLSGRIGVTLYVGADEVGAARGALSIDISTRRNRLAVEIQRGATRVATADVPLAEGPVELVLTTDGTGHTALLLNGTDAASGEAGAITGTAFGFELASSECAVESLAVEGGLGGEDAASAALPTGRWVHLAESGLTGWDGAQSWTTNQGVISPGDGRSTLVHRVLSEESPAVYEWAVDVWCPSHIRRRDANNLAGILFVVDGQGMTWTFTSRESGVEGVSDTNAFRTFPYETWITVTITVGPQEVAGNLGGDVCWRVPRTTLRSGGQPFFGLRVFPNEISQRVIFRDPRVRITQ